MVMLHNLYGRLLTCESQVYWLENEQEILCINKLHDLLLQEQEQLSES